MTLIFVGKVRDRYLQLGIDEFKKRLSRFCTLEFIQVKEEAIPEKSSEKELDLVRKKEGEAILGRLKEGAYVIAMDIDGKQLTSEELADKMQHIATYESSHLFFIIGGSVGLSDAVKRRVDFKLSFSKMTFPHQLFQLMLLEQVYRGFKINAKESYHK